MEAILLLKYDMSRVSFSFLIYSTDLGQEHGRQAIRGWSNK